jgi:hypothetical protein
MSSHAYRIVPWPLWKERTCEQTGCSNRLTNRVVQQQVNKQGGAALTREYSLPSLYTANKGIELLYWHIESPLLQERSISQATPQTSIQDRQDYIGQT